MAVEIVSFRKFERNTLQGFLTILMAAIGLEIRTTCGTGLGAGLSEGIRIAGTPLPVVGIAMGNQTNDNEGPQFAFFFPAPAGADIGPCVGTADSGAGAGFQNNSHHLVADLIWMTLP